MLPSFLTHYDEADRGPFKNVGDLSNAQLDRLIAIEKYAEKFACTPPNRPFYAVPVPVP